MNAPKGKKPPEQSKASFMTDDTINNAIRCLTSGGDRDVISNALSEAHKVRSFYNNILDPASPNMDVTCDTHAIGAAWLRPLGNGSTEVAQGLGTGLMKNARPPGYEPAGGSSVRGLSGLYALYATAYRETAKELGVLPRELQSILWEEKIRIFKNQSEATKDKVDELWRKFNDDPKVTLKATQAAVFKTLDEAEKTK